MIHSFFKIFLTVLIIIDPLGCTPVFLSTTSHLDELQRKKVLRKAIRISAVVLALFVLLGRIILDFFGITPGAFYIAGGILFFFIAFDMISSKPRLTKSTPADSENAQDTSLIAVFPIAIPLIAGPGILTTIMLYVSTPEDGIITIIMLCVSLILALIIDYWTLRFSTLLLKLLHRTGLFVIEKIMGLILSGLAVQLVYDGLCRLGFVQAVV